MQSVQKWWSSPCPLLAPWFSNEERAKVSAHGSNKNFIEVAYTYDRSLKWNPEDLKALNEEDYVIKGDGLCNRVTKEVMGLDPAFMIRFKCFLIAFIWNPVVLVGRISFHIMRLVVFVPITVGKDLVSGKGFSRGYKEVIHRVYKVWQAVVCLSGIEIGALTGLIYKPLMGREIIGLLERRVNDGEVFSTRKNYIYDNKGSWKIAYFQPCMQPLVQNIEHKAYKIL